MPHTDVRLQQDILVGRHGHPGAPHSFRYVLTYCLYAANTSDVKHRGWFPPQDLDHDERCLFRHRGLPGTLPCSSVAARLPHGRTSTPAHQTHPAPMMDNPGAPREQPLALGHSKTDSHEERQRDRAPSPGPSKRRRTEEPLGGEELPGDVDEEMAKPSDGDSGYVHWLETEREKMRTLCALADVGQLHMVPTWLKLHDKYDEALTKIHQREQARSAGWPAVLSLDEPTANPPQQESPLATGGTPTTTTLAHETESEETTQAGGK